MTGFQKLGLGVAAMFYLGAVVWVYFLSPSAVEFEPGVKVITIAHWQLEDGFRDGVNEAIKRFEKMKLDQGEKVKIIHSYVPNRGYIQWMTTQLVGGKPADIMEVTGDTTLQFKYLRPMSPYLGKPNPFNKGTKLEGIPWKDTYIDGMQGAFENTYAEWFKVPLAFLPIRLHVNLDLLENATGSRQMPRDLEEWLDQCQKVKEYAEKVQKPISAIGVRGTDRGTLARLYNQYYSETNGNLIDNMSRYCDGAVQTADILNGLETGMVDPARQTAAACITTDLGKYFIEGFPSVDLEQAKYLFTRGLVAFFPEGTWETMSLKNSPFDVGVVRVPPIGTRSEYSKYFTGKTTESGIQTAVAFGIPKRSKNFDLALEFMQYLSSFDIDQMVMNKCQWGPGVKFATYKEKALAPDLGGNPPIANYPYCIGYNTGSYRQMLESLENLARNQPADPGKIFMQDFKNRKVVVMKDQRDTIVESDRSNGDREMQRSQLSVGMLRSDATSEEKGRLELRRSLASEGLSEMSSAFYMNRMLLRALEKL